MYDRIGTHLSAALPDFSVNFLLGRIGLESKMLAQIIINLSDNNVGAINIAFENRHSLPAQGMSTAIEH
jgi:hypothetical protein